MTYMATFHRQYLSEEEGNPQPNTLIKTIILSVISFMRDKQITAERLFIFAPRNHIIIDLTASYGILCLAMFHKFIRKYLTMKLQIYLFHIVHAYLHVGR